MRKSIMVTPLAVLLAVGASGMYASAQDTTSAVLMGTVTGPDGKPLSGVRVYLTSGALLTPRDGRTDANGKFNFRLLPPGRYMVTYSMDGFISRKAEMSLLAGVAANGDIRLRAMDVQGAAIEIVAEVSNVITPDKTDTAVQTAFTSDRLEEIGGARGVAALQSLTPGLYGQISGGDMNSTTFSIRGGLGRGNKIIQDGQVVNDAMRGTYFNAGDTIEDLIESVAVIQSPLNAKMGNTDGGIISITTKRGGNSFSGSLRYSGTRGEETNSSTNAWQTTRTSYPNALGSVSGSPNPPNDMFDRNWQYSLTGPIIPNYLTFAIGGNLKPTIDGRSQWADAGGWAAGAWGNGAWGNPSQTRPTNGFPTLYDYNRQLRFNRSLGTFYLDNDPDSPGYGDIIRKSYWGDANGPDAWRYTRSSSGTNTFNLYLQLTPNHQFTWYYSQSNRIDVGVGSTLMENPSDNYTEQSSISWNVSYKAVLGAAGVLDARFGKSSSFSLSPRRGKESVQVRTWYSYIQQRDPNINNIDWYYGSWDKVADLSPGTPMTNWPNYNATTGVMTGPGTGWLQNGLIDGAWGPNSSSYANPSGSFSSIGENAGGDTGSDIISANANYQHMLEFKGQHIIDLGWNMNQVDAPGWPNGAKILAIPVGQLSYQLDNRHIGNIFSGSLAGNHGLLGADKYAGKYIVFDVGTTTIGRLEPHVLTRPNFQGNMITDGLIWNPGSFNGTVFEYGSRHPSLSRLNIENLPNMLVRYGRDDGDMRTTTSSVYANDMWTIDEHHSVMLGLRADIFSLKDLVRTVHSYTKITPRMEYKFDLNGDQRHLFAASLAQFHQMAAVNLYWPFIETKWANSSRKFWTGAALSDPNLRKKGYYLVGPDDLMNPDNYTEAPGPDRVAGGLFGDVDKNFRPPTSTELSVWYRHTFRNGGSFKISFNNRSWSDMYDMFPSDVFEYVNPNSKNKENKIKAVLKNTNDYTRTYNGVELLWDFPITRKVSFGGSYTFSRFLHNQTAVGSSEGYIGEGGVSNFAGDQIGLQTPWWFDELFSKDVVDESGNVVYNFGGRNAWAPMQMQYNEFSLNYYLIVNLTQGKARSNFTLRGNYRGGAVNYDYATIYTGRYVMPAGSDKDGNPIIVNQWPGQSAAQQLPDRTRAYFGQSTTNDSFSNDFSYNLNVPIARRLSWFMNVNVANIFHHQPYSSSVPSGDVGTATNGLSGAALQTHYIVPWPFRIGAATNNTRNFAWDKPYRRAGDPPSTPIQYYEGAPRNPFADGWNAVPNVGDSRYFYKSWSNQRSITMSTGIRF